MKFNAAILGGTGIVGQKFIELLHDHPWFEIEVIIGSKRSAGKKFSETVHWKSQSKIPATIANTIVSECSVDKMLNNHTIDVVFSALPSQVASNVEEDFAKYYPVISKASAHRMDPTVPLLIPEVNPEHLEILEKQQEERNWDGFLCTDPNCSTIQLALTLKPLMGKGLSKVVVTTMQSISGAGYPGVSSLDILGNVVPFIPGEEEKIETETKKILGTITKNQIINAKTAISASCNRVPVDIGHMESVFVKLDSEISLDEIEHLFTDFRGVPQEMNLPSAPKQPIIVSRENDRPQPKYDCLESNGMSIIVGKLQKDSIFDYKYTCLGNNLIRGAAGAGILSGELLIKKGFIV